MSQGSYRYFQTLIIVEIGFAVANFWSIGLRYISYCLSLLSPLYETCNKNAPNY